jgi:S1-C subfamily serine protease
MAFAIASLFWAPAYAEEWAPISPSMTTLYETDVSSLSAKDQIVSSWTRETLARPRADEATKQSYVQVITRRFDDCQTRRFKLGSQARRDRSGRDIGTLASEGDWQDVVPGSVNEGLWKTNCAVVNRPKGHALVKSLTDGDWRDLGMAGSGGAYAVAVKADDILKMRNGLVLALSRSDYKKPELVDGFAVRYEVIGTVIDCKNATAAIAAVDYYVSPSLRVGAERTDLQNLSLDPIPRTALLGKYLKDICGAAVEARSSAADNDGPSTGTAWGVDKGYLITASHVIEGGKTILVYSNGERVAEARVVANDPANDLALLKLAQPLTGTLKILPLADHSAALGKNVFTLGYPAPDVLGQNIKMTAGQVSSTSGPHDDASVIQISAPIQPGNSGGPVLGWDGFVVGVVKSKLLKFDDDDDDEPAPDGVNYAVKSAYIPPMLDDLPDLGNYEPIKPASQQEQMVEAARQAVFMLVVSK